MLVLILQFLQPNWRQSWLETKERFEKVFVTSCRLINKYKTRWLRNVPENKGKRKVMNEYSVRRWRDRRQLVKSFLLAGINVWETRKCERGRRERAREGDEKVRERKRDEEGREREGDESEEWGWYKWKGRRKGGSLLFSVHSLLSHHPPTSQVYRFEPVHPPYFWATSSSLANKKPPMFFAWESALFSQSIPLNISLFGSWKNWRKEKVLALYSLNRIFIFFWNRRWGEIRVCNSSPSHPLSHPIK